MVVKPGDTHATCGAVLGAWGAGKVARGAVPGGWPQPRVVWGVLGVPGGGGFGDRAGVGPARGCIAEQRGEQQDEGNGG